MFTKGKHKLDSFVRLHSFVANVPYSMLVLSMV